VASTSATDVAQSSFYKIHLLFTKVDPYEHSATTSVSALTLRT